MLKAIWPSIQHLPNHLPASANITTAGNVKTMHSRDHVSHNDCPGMMCYFLYWLIQVRSI